jgi:cobalt/nickel transport system permease protein
MSPPTPPPERPADRPARPPRDRLRVASALLFATAVAFIPVESPRPWTWVPIAGAWGMLAVVGAVALRGRSGSLLLRVVGMLPFLGLLALPMGLSRGWEPAAATVAKSAAAFGAVALLSMTTPMHRLLAALQELGVPRLLTAILESMHRYSAVLTDELARMRRARLARTFRPSTVGEWVGSSRTVGRLLVRSFERAERVHSAMLARGWDGTVRKLSVESRKVEGRRSENPAAKVGG